MSSTSKRNCAVINLVDKHLLVFQQIKLISIEGLFRTINYDIYHIATPQLYGVAFAYCPTVSLLHVSRSIG